MLKEKFTLYLCVLITCCISSVYADPLDQLLRETNDPIAGNPKGKVSVVEFFDYQCTYCKKMAPLIASMIKAHPNVRFVFKEYPVLGDISLLAARAALAAKKQGKYRQFNQALLEERSPITYHLILHVAHKIGLDKDRLIRTMNDRTIYQKIRENLELGENLNVTGTPSFFIARTNAENMSELTFNAGGMSFDQMQAAIKGSFFK